VVKYRPNINHVCCGQLSVECETTYGIVRQCSVRILELEIFLLQIQIIDATKVKRAVVFWDLSQVSEELQAHKTGTHIFFTVETAY
jgi:hypothetical protein